MSRTKSRTSINNLDEEINVKDYPYYRYIPIKSIAEKQKKNVSLIENKEKSIVIIPKSQTYAEVVNTNIVPELQYNYAEVVNTNIVPEAQYNTVAEIESVEQRSLEITADIQKNLTVLYDLQQQISLNQKTIQEQTISIDNNTDIINKQLIAFNHNTNALAYQYNQINDMNGQVHNLNQCIANMNNEISNKQNELDSIQKQLEDIQNQVLYHGNMLNAFNMMMQNPQYFMQMISVATQYMFN